MDAGTKPEEEGGPENEHDERSAGAGEIKKRSGKDGKNGGKKGDVGLKPTVKEQN